MSDAPTVSVVLIFLNEEHFLAEAIESVFAQTYGDWELLLVDDGSTDRSWEIAQRAEAEHPNRVRCLTHPNRENRGMSASRNLGLAHAKGRYIANLDGDDVWQPHKLERQVRLLEATPEAQMVFGPLEAWYSWTGSNADKNRDHLHGVGLGGAHPYPGKLVLPPALVTLFLRRRQFIPAGILVRTKALKDVGGAEDQFRGSYEDAVMQVKLCTAFCVMVDDDVSYRYRIHPGSTSRKDRRDGRAGEYQREYLDWVAAYLDESRINDHALRRALRSARRRLEYPRLSRLLDVHGHAGRFEHAVVRVGRRYLPALITNALWFPWTSLTRSVKHSANPEMRTQFRTKTR